MEKGREEGRKKKDVGGGVIRLSGGLGMGEQLANEVDCEHDGGQDKVVHVVHAQFPDKLIGFVSRFDGR